MAFEDVANAARDFGAIWVAPFRGSSKDYLIAGGVLAGGVAISPLDDNVDRWMVDNEDRGVLDALGPIRRGGDFYSLNKAVPYVGGLYIVGLATKHRGIRDGIFGCAASYGANTTMRHQVIYRLIGRNRPDTLRDHPEGYVPVGASPGDQYVFRVPRSRVRRPLLSRRPRRDDDDVRDVSEPSIRARAGGAGAARTRGSHGRRPNGRPRALALGPGGWRGFRLRDR